MKYWTILLLLIATSFALKPNLNCYPPMKYVNNINIRDIKVSLYTEGKENPYGPIRGLQSNIKISFVAEATDKILSSVNRSDTRINVSCFNSDLDHSEYLRFLAHNYTIISNNIQNKTVQFIFSSTVPIQRKMDYCYIKNFEIVDPAGVDKNGTACGLAPVYGISGNEALFNRDEDKEAFNFIDFSDYNSWRIGQDQNKLNTLAIENAKKATEEQNTINSKLVENATTQNMLNLALVVSAFITIFLSLYQFLSSKRPRIRVYPWLDYSTNPSFVYLIIENTGQDAAYDIRFEIEPPGVRDESGKTLSSHGFIQKLDELGPKMQLKHFFRNMNTAKTEETEEFKVKVTYKNRLWFLDKEHKDSFVINLNTFRDLQYLLDPNKEYSVKAMKDLINIFSEVQKDIKTLITENGLRIVTITKKQVEKDRAKEKVK